VLLRRLAGAGALLVLFCASCAARQSPSSQALEEGLARAASLVQAGCYACLREAEALYGALAEQTSAAEAHMGRATAVLLLSARSRELGLDRWERQVEALVAALGRPDLLDTYRRVTAQIAPPIVVGTPDELDARAARAQEARASEIDRDALARLAQHDPVAAHFLVLLACGERTALPVAAVDALPAAIRSVPLVAYAAGACSPAYADALDDALRQEPRFAEARYHRGVQALGARAFGTADVELAAAVAAFPEAPAMHLARGHLHLQLQEFPTALEAFDGVLRVAGDHRGALLGRVEALSHMGRFTDAIAGADRLLDLGTWLLGDAYYWRAWNRRQLKQLEDAADDIESAKAFLINADVPKLAGFIAYDRERYDEARAELETARERAAGDCDVPFALGLVYARLAREREGASAFGAAADCAAAAQQSLRERLAGIEATDLSGARRAAMRVRAEQALAGARRQEGLAAINAARLHGRSGNAAAARVLAERAAAWDAHREEAERLLERLRP